LDCDYDVLTLLMQLDTVLDLQICVDVVVAAKAVVL
jgi:hypothetical protein